MKTRPHFLKSHSGLARTTIAILFVLAQARCASAQIAPAASIDTPNNASGDNAPGIYLMDALSGQPKKLVSLDNCRWQGFPQWSHDGKQIAFEAWPNEVKGADTKIFVVSVDGGKPSDLGLGKGASWSVDGKQIVFSIPRGNSSNTKNGVWIMNADGSGRQWLCSGGRASCSPDGTRIALVDSKEGNDSLYTYDLLSAELKRVLQESYLHVYGSAWSPDSKRICFVGNRRNSPPELAIIDADDSQKSYQVRLKDVLGRNPSWAPGSKILLMLQSENAPQLYAINPDDETEPAILNKQAEKQSNIDASWSPDGRRIAFSFNPDSAP
jgi:Tol biopolymer transport system component